MKIDDYKENESNIDLFTMLASQIFNINKSPVQTGKFDVNDIEAKHKNFRESWLKKYICL